MDHFSGSKFFGIHLFAGFTLFTRGYGLGFFTGTLVTAYAARLLSPRQIAWGAVALAARGRVGRGGEVALVGGWVGGLIGGDMFRSTGRIKHDQTLHANVLYASFGVLR